MAKGYTIPGAGIFQSILGVVQYTSPVKLSNVSPGERIITLEEVSSHDTNKDCWVVIYDRVYDVTDFLEEVSIFFIQLKIIKVVVNVVNNLWIMTCKLVLGIPRI